MTSQGYRNPPLLVEEKPYDQWKNEISIWRLVTELEKKKQALAVVLSLTGKAREVALEISSEDLNNDDGMATLLAKLDGVFERETADRTYEAYSEFELLLRKPDEDMRNYLSRFDIVNTKMKKFEMELPDTVLACKLLKGANLALKERQLVLAAIGNLEYKSMASALKRIFGEEASTSSVQVKQESAYLSNKFANFRSDNGTNPLRKDGSISQCAICGSRYHWVKQCPRNKKSMKPRCQICDSKLHLETSCPHNEKNHVLMSVANELTAHTKDLYGCAILDSACTRSVCGKMWLDDYLQQLDDFQLQKIQTDESDNIFKFGDGRMVNSLFTVKIPGQIGQTEVSIICDVVDDKIPLLLSKASMRKAYTVIDFAADKVRMFDKPVKTVLNMKYYCVNILPNKTDSNYKGVYFTESNNVFSEKDLLKLHRQFGHASYERLLKLFKDSGKRNQLPLPKLKKIVDACEVCKVHKRSSPKPGVGLPHASDFNESVAIDLHQLGPSLWYMHIIDMFSRFSSGAIINCKSAVVIAKEFLFRWISIFGPPGQVFTDNGREFNNEIFLDMAENFNIRVKTSAAESPWSNGMVERHNSVLTEILLKIRDSESLDWKTAFSWALCAKNSLHNAHGYSPYQLVFGRNPNLPNILTDKPPAWDGTSVSELIASHLNALHASRKAFLESECSERIRRALRSRTRTYNDEIFATGDTVYYKRENSEKLKGPAKVIGTDGSVVFIRHGGLVVRVHKCRLMHKQSEMASSVNFETSSERKYPIKSVTKQETNPQMDFEDVLSDEETCRKTVVNVEEIEDGDSSGSDDEQPEEESPRMPPQPSLTTSTSTNALDNSPQQLLLKRGQMISFKHQGDRKVAKVLGRAGKATGKYSRWYNIEYSQPDSIQHTTSSINIDEVDDLSVIDSVPDSSPVTSNDVDEVMLVDEDLFHNAKLEELESWQQNNVYTVEQNKGQKLISTRWVCTMKKSSNGPKPKARLVVRGFEEDCLNELKKDSPTCSKESLRILLAVMVQKKWSPKTMDIKTAFLQGKSLERDVFIKPPKPSISRGNVVWRLKKCVYGLTDASMYWYESVKDALLKLGARISGVDPAVFYWFTDGLQGVIALHVDDFLWAGSKDFEQKFIKDLKDQFKVGSECFDSFRYLGLQLETDSKGISLSQHDYINSLRPIDLHSLRTKKGSDVLIDSDILKVRSLLGQILWVSNQTRPDVSFASSTLTSTLNNCTAKTAFEVNKIVRQLKAHDVSLKFFNLGNDDIRFIVYSDASFGNLRDGGTQGGHVIFLADGSKQVPLCWQSKRIKRVVKSTLSAETLSMSDGVDSAVLLAAFYSELTTGIIQPHKFGIECRTDSRSLCDAIKSTKSVSEKRLRVDIHGLKEMVLSKQISSIKKLPSDLQLADCLTKKGASSRKLIHAFCCGKID